jgi:hypothetical protein
MTRFKPQAASDYLFKAHGLRRSPRTLANLRYKGGGPRYTRVSAIEILYAQDDLDEWAESRTSRRFHHTAEESHPNV